ncbi:MAG: glycogen-binding domain-containing protein [Balneolaceae bacterium]|nr:glycogen-binding domain-containing protein [Balneolaceae bacterium]
MESSCAFRLVWSNTVINFTTTTSTGGGGGFPPVGGPPGTTTETVELTNRLYRIGIGSSFPLNEQFSLFMNVEGLRYAAGGSSTKINDLQISGGVRFSIEPSIMKNKSGIEPEWNIKPHRQRLVIPFKREGQLYLVGDFNNWNRPGIPLVEHREGEFVAQLELRTGAYEYKVLQVESGKEQWVSFSEDVYTVTDGYGGENAMLLIEQ